MSTPWFFLSYASLSERGDKQVEEFCSDLVEALREEASLKEKQVHTGDIGFFAPTEMAEGTNWPVELAEKLRTCRVLVCLYSDGYFQSAACGKEFKLFNSRIDAYVDTHPNARRPPLIVPVLWTTPTDFPVSLPQAASEIHYENPYLDTLLRAHGLRYIKTLPSHKEEYDEYVLHLARTIKEAAEAHALPELDKVPAFDKAWNAWVEPPVAPDALEATLIAATCQISLTWEPNSANQKGFYVERLRHGGRDRFVKIRELRADRSSYTDAKIAPGTKYAYRVRAYNDGGCSDYTETVEVETPGQPPPPMPSDPSGKAVSAREVELGWEDNSGGSCLFKIERCDDLVNGNFKRVGKTGQPGVTIYKDGGLKPASTYVYRVCASDAGSDDSDSDYSDEVTIKTPNRWPTFLILPLLVAAAAVLAVIPAFRCAVVPSLCTPTPTPAPTHTPVLTPTPFADLFQPASGGASGGLKWAAAKSWSVPDQWSHWGDSPLAGWLDVKGTKPGAVKEMKFGDSIIRFRVEFVKGTKAGWVLHATADEQGVRDGYCFLLERQAGADRPFKFSASVCRSGEDIRPDIDEVGITQYGKPDDFIQVEAVIKDNLFQFYFSLRNYQENASPYKSRGNVNQCYRVSVGGKAGVSAEGAAGLFAGDDDTEFKVSNFAVYPLTDQNLNLVQCRNRKSRQDD